MSVRIHQLSKKIGMENAELLSLLKERGFDVKTASSSIDNISADALVDEFSKKAEESAEKPESASSKGTEKPAEKPVSKPSLPAGAIVKSAKDVEDEKESKAAENKPKAPEKPVPAKNAPPPPPSPKTPGSGPKAPGPPPPAQTPPSKSPPPPPAASPDMAKSPSQPKTPPPPGAANMPAPPKKEEASAPETEETETTEASGEQKKVQVKPPIVVRDFAGTIGLKPFRLISELMEMGIFASMNQALDEESAIKVAQAHGYELEIQHRGENQKPSKKKEAPKVDESKLLEPRPPVICILGHVDHGKTTLLDVIRQTKVVEGEAGGITQHIGAYQIEHNGNKVTFLDTPGHAAFSKMRERGANVTDVAILVVAADDGFMPQTDEALNFANRAQVAKIVAVNKIDLPGADLDKVKTQMGERGIPPEDWGGETITVPISALKQQGIDELLEMIQLQTEIMELKANPKADPEGIIIESQIEQGRGCVSTVIVQRGTLKVGDALLSGTSYCRVRSLLDASGNAVKAATPSTPVRVTGWSDPPEVGATFEARKNERVAKREAEDRAHEMKLKMASDPSAAGGETGGPSVEDLFAAIEKQEKKHLRVVLRADVAGSLEALSASLAAIESDKVDLEIIQEDVGLITKNDVEMAHAGGGATIIGFNTRLENGVQGQAKHHGINIFTHNIIYELIDIVKDAMADMLEPELQEKKLGSAEVRQTFSIGKGRYVAGCMVTEGAIRRDAHARLIRNGEVVHDGKMDTLRRFKDDVAEVRAGTECGIHLVDFDRYQEGDLIECFEIQKIRPSL